MDHIEQPSDPAYPELKIPCLTRVEYDQQEWMAYPERRGFKMAGLLTSQFSDRAPKVTAAFLQDWLYFGTLWIVLGRNGTKSNYVNVDRAGNMTLCTKRLNSDMEQRLSVLRNLEHKDTPSLLSILREIESCLMTVSKFCLANTCHGDHRRGMNTWPLTPEIDLSVRHLGEYLTAVMSIEWDRSFGTKCQIRNLPFPCGHLPLLRIMGEGRCPSERNMIAENLSSATAYYATRLKRPQRQEGHRHCSESLCYARQIDESTYSTRHTKQGCQCPHFGPPVDQIVAIIQSGQIPLVSVEVLDASPFIKVNVEKYKKGKNYIAISHLWSDGLGNTSQNTLPYCQLVRMKNTLDELSLNFNGSLSKGSSKVLGKNGNRSSVLFWMDTLCVPVQKEHREFRTMAIKSMRDIYLGASGVLVLDDDLQRSVQGYVAESFIRTLLSPWMQRLWTLQEGVCAGRLYIKFADGIMDAGAEYSRLLQSKQEKYGGLWDLRADRVPWILPSSQAQCVYRDLKSLQTEIAGSVPGTTSAIPSHVSHPQRIQWRCNAIMHAYKAALYRSSCRKEDQFVCMASLLKWNLSQLEGVSLERRMHALLSCESHLPQGLLFLTGPRMTEPCWTWAVSQFGGCKSLGAGVQADDTTPGIVTGRGFAVRYPSLALPAVFCEIPQASESFRFFVRFGTGLLFTADVKKVDQYTQGHGTTRNKKNEKRRFYVLFWNHTSLLLPWVPMKAVIVSAPWDDKVSGESNLNHPRECRFECLAELELSGSPQQGATNEVQSVPTCTWIIQ